MGRNEKRRQEAGAAPTRFSSLQEAPGFGPAGRRDPTGIPRLWAGASGRAPRSISRFCSPRWGRGGRYATASASWGVGVVIARRGGEHI